MGQLRDLVAENVKMVSTIETLVAEHRNGSHAGLEEHAINFLYSCIHKDMRDDIDIFARGMSRCCGKEQDVYLEIRPKGFVPRDKQLVVIIRYTVGARQPEASLSYYKIYHTLIDGSLWKAK